MQIHDAWNQAKEFSVDKQGFAIDDFTTNYPADKWQDDDLVREKFYPDVVEFLKKTQGAKRVEVFDHTIRTKNNSGGKKFSQTITNEKNTSQRAPVSLVHCDYTHESGPTRVRQLFKDEAEDLLSRRVAFFNVWKPLNRVEENPLAMCDVTSAPKEDFFKLYLRYRDRNGENYVLKYNPQHKWYYFPYMNNDKVITLKTYESDTNRARFVGHSAFVDPTSAEDAIIRESVEIRTICFY